MLRKKSAAYLKSVAATGSFHLRGMPFVPKVFMNLSPFNREAYNTFLTEASHWNLGRKAVIYDVGANNGDFAMAFHAAYPDAELHLFEPLAPHLERLQNMNAVGKFNWKIQPYALGSRSERLKIEIPDGFEDASSLLGFSEEYLKHNPQSAKTVKQVCEVRPLDELSSHASSIRPIDLLKIDVEGFEFAVLEGATETLKLVKNAVVEVSLLRHSGAGFSPIARMVETMGRAGLELFRMQPTLFDSAKGNRPLEYDLYFERRETRSA